MCVYTCNTITFDNLDVESSFFGHPVHLKGNTGQFCICRSSDQSQGYRSKRGENPHSCSVKHGSAITAFLSRIESCDVYVQHEFLTVRK